MSSAFASCHQQQIRGKMRFPLIQIGGKMPDNERISRNLLVFAFILRACCMPLRTL